MSSASAEVHAETWPPAIQEHTVVMWRCRMDHVTRIDVPILGLPLGGVSVVSRERRRGITCPQMALVHLPGDEYETRHPLPGEDWGIYLDLSRYERITRSARGGWTWLDPRDYLTLMSLVSGREALARDHVINGILSRVLSAIESDALLRGDAEPSETEVALELSSVDGRLPRRSLSDRRSLSVTTLARRFRSAFGLPVKQFELRSRMSRAVERLASESDIAQIAIDLGFSSHSHFTFMFRQMFGCTPAMARSALRRHAPSAPQPG